MKTKVVHANITTTAHPPFVVPRKERNNKKFAEKYVETKKVKFGEFLATRPQGR